MLICQTVYLPSTFMHLNFSSLGGGGALSLQTCVPVYLTLIELTLTLRKQAQLRLCKPGLGKVVVRTELFLK